MSAANMHPWQSRGSPQRVSSQKSQRIIVAFQYGLLVLSGADSAGAIYLILGPGNEVTIAGANPILTAVSTSLDPYKLLNTEISSTRRLYPSHTCYSISLSLGDTSKEADFLTTTKRISCAPRA